MTKTQRITFTALGAALIFVATFFVRIPTGLGYVNGGDGVIILCGAFLGGVPGLAAAAVGSALADLAAGYVIYAPITALIKGLMGLISGLLLYGQEKKTLRALLTSLLCCGVMVTGYFCFECLLYGVPAAAVSLLPNLMQGVCGGIIGVLGVRLRLFK